LVTGRILNGFNMIQLCEQPTLSTSRTECPEILTIRWTIGAAPEAGPSALERTLTLRLDLQRETFEASLGDENVCAGGFVHLDDRQHAMVHLDCEGVFSATIGRNHTGAIRLLYARTSLLTRLGIPGGRADAPTLLAAPATESARQATRAS